MKLYEVRLRRTRTDYQYAIVVVRAHDEDEAVDLAWEAEDIDWDTKDYVNGEEDVEGVEEIYNEDDRDDE